jgi:hypothetical protein
MSYLCSAEAVQMQSLDICGLCPRSRGPLIEIDHYGERPIGCVECNRWTWRGSKRLFMELPDEDIQALRNLSNARHKAEDTSP